MWITLTPADFASRLTVGEVAQIARANAQGDNRAAILAEVSGEVRGYVAVSNALDVDGSIPDELKNAALAIATERFISQFPDSGLLTPSREEAAKAARALLGQVAAGKFRIVPPETESSPQPATPSPAFGNPHRHFRHRNEEGI